MSRQARYQADHLARGLCVQCSEDAIEGATRCAKHLLKHRLKARKATQSRPWRPGSPGRPPVDIGKR